MTNFSYNDLFSRLDEVEPRAELERAIMARVYQARLRQARLRAGFYAFFAIATVISIAPASQRLMSAAADSGFFQFLSLGWSDGLSMLGSWKTFMLTVAESAPILEMTVTLGLILLCGHSLRRSVQYMIKVA